ncbi:MAG: hypothetical protein KDD82_03350 [Planctomycetes bacterium]|nr:hypothetical protein [Planctomycetota bacterium]
MRWVLGVLVVATVGCWTPSQRKPLFGGEPEAPPERAPAANSRPYRERPAEALLRKLRAGTPTERDEAVHELLERGPNDEVAALLAAALDEELLLVDLLEDLQLELAPAAPRPEVHRTEAEWVGAKLSEALQRYGRGDLYGALRIADAVLTLEPAATEAERLRRLRRQTLDRLVRESVLSADLEVRSERLGPGVALDLALVLENRGDEPLVLEEGEQQVLGVLVQSYEELSPGGTRTRLHTEVPLRLPEEVELAPQERVRIPIRLVAPHRDLGGGAVGRYHFAGRLRMDTLRVGDRIHSLFLPLLPLELVVLPPEAEDLWSEPATAFLGALEAAYAAANDRERAPRAQLRLFAAGILAVHHDERQGLSAIFSALEGARGDQSRVLCALLSAVTREALGYTREEWLAWWRSERARPLHPEPRAE